jgi:hypothetical protein
VTGIGLGGRVAVTVGVEEITIGVGEIPPAGKQAESPAISEI